MRYVAIQMGFYEVGRLKKKGYIMINLYCNFDDFFCLTSMQILTIPVKALIAVGALNSSPKHIILPPTFPVSK